MDAFRRIFGQLGLERSADIAGRECWQAPKEKSGKDPLFKSGRTHLKFNSFIRSIPQTIIKVAEKEKSTISYYS